MARTTSGIGFLDRRRGDQGHAFGEAGAVLRGQRDAERAQIIELGREAAGVERAVGAGDARAAGAEDGGEGQHPAAADSAEEILVGHCRRCPMRARGLVQLMLPMKIAVVAPSCTLRPEAAEAVIAIAAARGDAELVIHPQCFLRDGHFAGPDAARLEALREVMADDSVDAVWFARGGYGSNRIAEAAAARPACRGARQDLSRLFRCRLPAGGFHKAGLDVAHGPMVQDVARAGGEAAIHRALDWLVRRDEAALEPGLRPGQRAMAFNLTVLSHLLGTAIEPDFTGAELLIEDVAEHEYRIDRAMFHVTGSAGDPPRRGDPDGPDERDSRQ